MKEAGSRMGFFSSHSQRLACGALCGLAAVVLQGCTSFDPLDNRAETLNLSLSSYMNTASLLNLARASLGEPLVFANVTTVQAHNSATGNLGLPSITLGPILPTAVRNYVFGSNSTTFSGSSDFSISLPDDPNSTAALLAPATPALLAFLLRQGYDRAQVFYLLVDSIRIVDRTRVTSYFNDPNDTQRFVAFGGQLATLLRNGLTAQIAASAVPASRSFPPSRFCFDPQLPPPFFAQNLSPSVNSTCDNNAGWVQAKSEAGDAPGEKPANSKPQSRSGEPAQRSGAARAADASGTPPQSSYEIEDTQGRRVAISLRSALAIHNYLGAFIARHNDIINVAEPRLGGTGGFIQITEGATDCFVNVVYSGRRFCIPKTAFYTKNTLSILRQIINLNTTPNASAPMTTVVRVTP